MDTSTPGHTRSILLWRPRRSPDAAADAHEIAAYIPRVDALDDKGFAIELDRPPTLPALAGATLSLVSSGCVLPTRQIDTTVITRWLLTPVALKPIVFKRWCGDTKSQRESSG